MSGLDVCKTFYEENLLPSLKKEFPNDWNKILICKIGRGSECYNFDDEISKDHDFSSGVQLVITEEMDREFGFHLTRFYHQFEKSGIKSFYRERREGVFSLPEFLEMLIGTAKVPVTPVSWLSIPEHALYEARNGKIFQKGDGTVYKALTTVKTEVPLDVFKQRLSSHLILAYQSGVYNVERMQKRGDKEAVAFSINKYIEHISHVIFALNKEPTPYYKWCFRAMKDLHEAQDVVKLLSTLLLNEKSDKITLITQINKTILLTLKTLGFTKSIAESLEMAAFLCKDSIEDKRLRAIHIMEN